MFSNVFFFHVHSWSAEKIFEVRHVSQIGDKFVVNIDEASCTCRKWSISGIPCCHSLSAMKFLGINGEEFISTWFRKSTYEETYSSIIFPINGQNLWDITPYPDLLPPEKRIMPGRPKKKRRLQDWELRKDETQMTNARLRKRCGFCRQLGHNKSKCSQYKAHLKTISEASNQPNPPTTVPSTESAQQHNPPPPVASAQSSQQQNPPPTVASAQSSQQQNPPSVASTQSSQQQNPQPLPSAQSSQQHPPSSAQPNRPSQAPRHTAPIRPKLNARRGRIWKP